MKKALSLFLSLIMVITSICVFPLGSFASENSKNFAFTLDSSDIYTAPKMKSKFKNAAALSQSDIILIRDTVVQRLPSCNVELDGDMSVSEVKSYLTDAFYAAMSFAYSKTNIDAQYAQYQFENVAFKSNYSNGIYHITYSFTYRSNAKEELEVNSAVKNFFASVDLNNISDYDLLKKIHDFVLDSCTYSNDFKKNSVYTAWGALCDSDAVCEGYALAFYRLCREAGLDAVMDVSDPDEGCHAWNIVNLGGKCYYVDATWDDSFDENDGDKYTFFLVDYDTLKGGDTCNEHKHYDEQNDYNYINSNYIAKADGEPFSSFSNSISSCTINIDSNGNVLSVKDRGGNMLTNGVDYTVTSDSNSFVKINGTGNYFGYSVRKKSINNFPVNVDSFAKIYKGYAYASVNVPTLSNGSDCIIYYFNNDKPGTATAMAYGIGKNTGFCQKDFTVTKGNVNDYNISLSYDSVLYNSSEKKPGVAVDGLTKDVDYTVSYSNNIDEGTANVIVSGIGNYEGTAVKNFTIYKRNIADKYMYLNNNSFEYTGSEIKPRVYVSACSEGIDYVLSYSNNVNVGTASVTVTGIGYYSGSKTLNFTINAKPMPDVAATQTTAPATTVPTAQNATQAPAQTTAAPQTTKAQKANSKKTAKPKKVKISKLKTSKKAVTISWKKVSASGYQIQYSTNKKFKNAKTVTVKKCKTTSKKITKLKKGKKYYFRIRAYKTQGKKNVYGAWSNAKNIKVK